MKKRVLYLMIILVFILVSCVGVATFSMNYVYGIICALILFSIISCSGIGISAIGKASSGSGIEVPIESVELGFSFLDDELGNSEDPTDTLLVKVTNDPELERYTMMSKKTDNGEYIAFFTDDVTGHKVIFYYKSGEVFPYRVTLPIDGAVASGYITAHRKDTGRFDIVWTRLGLSEAFRDLPLGNDIYSSKAYPDLDAEGNYKMQTILNGVTIYSVAVAYMNSNRFMPRCAKPNCPQTTDKPCHSSKANHTKPTSVVEEAKPEKPTDGKYEYLNIKYKHGPNAGANVADNSVIEILGAGNDNHLHLDIEIPSKNISNFVVDLELSDDLLDSMGSNPDVPSYIKQHLKFYWHKDGGTYNHKTNSMLLVESDNPNNFHIVRTKPGLNFMNNGRNLAIDKDNTLTEYATLVFRTTGAGVIINGVSRNEFRVNIR